MITFHKTTIEVEIDVMIGDDSAFNHKIPFECYAQCDSEPDPTVNDSEIVVKIEDRHVIPYWINSEMVDKAERWAQEEFECNIDKYEI